MMKKFQNPIVVIGLSVFAIACFFSIYGMSTNADGDGFLEAGATIIGAFTAATGAAIAVLYSLEHQRKSDFQKINAALVSEMLQIAIRISTYCKNFENNTHVKPVFQNLLDPKPHLYISSSNFIGLLNKPELMITFYYQCENLSRMLRASNETTVDDRSSEEILRIVALLIFIAASFFKENPQEGLLELLRQEFMSRSDTFLKNIRVRFPDFDYSLNQSFDYSPSHSR